MEESNHRKMDLQLFTYLLFSLGFRSTSRIFVSSLVGELLPEGYYKRSNQEILKRCASLDTGYKCPSGYQCLCSPCRMSEAVEVFGAGTPCARMSACLTAQQRELFTILIRDNLKTGLNVSWKLHALDSLHGYNNVQMGPIENTTKYFDPWNFYNITLAVGTVGNMTLEVFLGGKLIPQSPFLLNIVERDCGENRKADVVNGICEDTREIVYVPDGMKIFGLIAFGILEILSIGFGIWTILYRNSKIINASQPPFVFLLLLGSMISAFALLLLPQDDKIFDPGTINIFCQLSFWCYGIGFALSYSALYAKTIRMKCLVVDNLHHDRRGKIKIGMFWYMRYVAAAMLYEGLLLTVLTALYPIQFRRTCLSPRKSDFCQNVGYCSLDKGISLVLVQFLSHVIGLFMLLLICYEARNIPAELAEIKWITASTISNLQILAVPPLTFAVLVSDPILSELILMIAIFTSELGRLLMIFVPKLHMNTVEYNDEEESKEDVIWNLRRRVRRNSTPQSRLNDSGPFQRKQTKNHKAPLKLLTLDELKN